MLGFESMAVDGTYKYESARRLSNSDSLIINPYFPTKWKLYWWDFGWEEYDQVNIPSFCFLIAFFILFIPFIMSLQFNTPFSALLFLFDLFCG